MDTKDDKEIIPKISKDKEYQNKLFFVNEIATPMASRQLYKNIMKLLKKANNKKEMYTGVKSVKKAIRKDETGMVIMAGDFTPIDILSFMPTLCEEKNIPYVYVPSGKDISSGIGTIKSSKMIVMVKYNSTYGDLYNEIKIGIEKGL